MRIKTSAGEVELTTEMVTRGIAPRVACPECHGLEAHHHDHCSVARRTREATLVALVNAVPEGLDPIGWRAAVLAGREYWQRDKSLPNWPNPTEAGGFTMFVSRAIRGTFTPEPTSCAEASLAAYHRAIAPVSKMAPERRDKRAATLSIYLPDDDDLGW